MSEIIVGVVFLAMFFIPTIPGARTGSENQF